MGMNWIVTSRVSPGGMTSGNGTTPMTLNSAELEVMPVTIRSQLPLLPMVNVLLFMPPGQVLSKVIGSLTTMTGCPPCALNVRMTAGLTGSLELTVNVVVLLPALVGVKRASNGKQKSGLTITGKPDDGVVTENCALDEVIELTSRSAVPVLQTLSVATLELPTHVVGKLGLEGIWICGTQQTMSTDV